MARTTFIRFSRLTVGETSCSNSSLASAKAFELAKDEFEQLVSPTVSLENRMKVVRAIFDGKNYSDLFKSFMQLLVSKNRLNIFLDIMAAYQSQSDLLHG